MVITTIQSSHKQVTSRDNCHFLTNDIHGFFTTTRMILEMLLLSRELIRLPTSSGGPAAPGSSERNPERSTIQRSPWSREMAIEPLIQVHSADLQGLEHSAVQEPTP